MDINLDNQNTKAPLIRSRLSSNTFKTEISF